MCHEVTFHSESDSADDIICSCLPCIPTHVPSPTATSCTRLRCLLLNWIHSQHILDHPPCEHTEFLNSFPSKLAKVEHICACDTRTMTILGLQSNPDVWQVQVQISTEELAGELSLVEDHTTYLIHVLGGAFDKDGKIISVASEVEGETVELLQMISAIWVDADKKDGLKKVWTWDAIVTLMRDVTKASYDVKGERTLRC